MILHGPDSASKHAVKGFTDALRMELEEAGDPVSVTLIKPSAIDTPYMEHARNYLDSRGTKNPPPSYDPELVAKAMIFACDHDRRDIVIGFGGWAVSAMGAVAPRLTDYIMEATGVKFRRAPTLVKATDATTFMPPERTVPCALPSPAGRGRPVCFWRPSFTLSRRSSHRLESPLE